MPEFYNVEGSLKALPDTVTTPNGRTFDVVAYQLPTSWATYLLYGDGSNLTDGEIKQIDQWCETEGNPHFVDVGQSGWSSHNDADADCDRVSTFIAHLDHIGGC
tara:strand:- start:1086 stop:1397 length:312 start_codon:yes stop_codon:yes gene_type:complete